MITQEFRKLYGQLNKEQGEAVEAIEGPVMVVAGPGTGKTQILTLRIANILARTDTAPDSILALTFTESGAHSMRERLTEIISASAYRVGIFTFHGFCNDLIKRFPDYFPRIIGGVNITHLEQIKIVKGVIKRLKLEKLKPFGNNFYYLKPLVKAISDCKREDSFPEADSQKNKEFLKIYKEYQKELEKRNLYDYDDMILEVIEALRKNKDLLLQLQEQYQYLLADEHQDTNNAQNKLLELLASYYDEPNIFIVGDERQAIFRFQGASLNNFNYFKKLYKHVKIITLKSNYRSHQKILDAAGTGLTGRKGAGGVELYSFSKPDVEMYFLAQDIKHRVFKKEHSVLPSVAILYRDNRDAVGVIKALERVGVPFVVESDQNLLEDEEMKKVTLLLRAVNDPTNDELISKVLHIDFLGLPASDVFKYIKSRGQYVQPQISNIKRLIFNWGQVAHNKNLTDLFEIVVRESGLLNFLMSHDLPDKLGKLSAFYDQIRGLVEVHLGLKLSDFIEYLDLLEEHDLLIKRDSKVVPEGAVRLMTAHRAKGQEFDWVYIVGATDGHWGGRRVVEHFNFTKVGPLGEKDDDERRLFYVVLTRARAGITITYSRSSSEGRSQLPSQFVAELDPKLVEIKSSEEYEKKFEKNKAHLFAKSSSPKVNIKDKKYLRQLFLSQSFSVTALNNYLNCPWRYFYVNLLRIPEPQTKYQMYGTAVHNALRDLFIDLKKGENWSVKKLIQVFESYLKKQPLASDFEETLKRGRKALTGYYHKYINDWNKNVILEYKIEGPLDDKVKLTGRLDKIEILGGKRVNVVDYKTSKPKTPKKIEEEGILRQLTFYKLLISRFIADKFDMQSGEIDFTQPDDRGQYKKIKYEITDKQVSDLERLIKKTSSEILALKFWGKFCDDKNCKYCSLRRMMV